MSDNLYCPMIHGGLNINLNKANNHNIYINPCPCRTSPFLISSKDKIWNNPALINLIETNNKNIWDSGCINCKSLEESGQLSLRTGTLQMFGVKKNLVGPKRLDLMFDIGCNLACRICGPNNSTFWQKHLIDNNLSKSFEISAESKVEQMISILHTIDLSQLELVVFCGGETLMGTAYWKVAETIANLSSPEKITLSFQTNGTQSIHQKFYSLIEKFHLLKLNISLDGIENQFNYMRWPADWNQVVNNLNSLRNNLPVNTMFLVEETISIFNLYYQDKLKKWVEDNFTENRLGDKINHTRHLVHGIFSLENITQEYYDALEPNLQLLVKKPIKENSFQISQMLKEIEKFDKIRKQDWSEVFPDVYSFYKNYL